MLQIEKSHELKPLIGTYECKADVKGRLLLPAPLKKQVADSAAEGFILKRSIFSNCLELYPRAEFDKTMAKISKLNQYIPKNKEFIRKFSVGIREVELDSLGRIQIPKDLAVFAGILKNAVITSAVTYVEIWDKDRYEEAVSGSDEDFAKLAEDVMGNQNDDDNGLS